MITLPLWNQINYRRRQADFSNDGGVWAAGYTDLDDDYAPIIGKSRLLATCLEEQRGMAVVPLTRAAMPLGSSVTRAAQVSMGWVSESSPKGDG